MKPTILGAWAILVMVLAAGCTKSAAPGGAASTGASATSAMSADAAQSALHSSPDDPIRTAIQAHLAHRGNLNLQSFETDVKQVNVQGDHAEAQVEFHVKGGPGVMQLTYQLEKRDNAWSVIESVPANSNFSHPPLDGSAPVSGTATAPADPMSDPTRFFKGAAPAQPPIHP